MEDGICDDETPLEEDARLDAAADARKAAVDDRIAALEAESLGDQLRSAVTILLNPDIRNYPDTQRVLDIVTFTLGVIAGRELDKEAS